MITDNIIHTQIFLSSCIEDIKKIDSDKLLSMNEIKEIYLVIDKSRDYMDNNDWINDIKYITNEIIKLKKKYKINLTLKKVKLTITENTSNYYEYIFTDSDGFIFIKPSFIHHYFK